MDPLSIDSALGTCITTFYPQVWSSRKNDDFYSLFSNWKLSNCRRNNALFIIYMDANFVIWVLSGPADLGCNKDYSKAGETWLLLLVYLKSFVLNKHFDN